MVDKALAMKQEMDRRQAGTGTLLVVAIVLGLFAIVTAIAFWVFGGSDSEPIASVSDEVPEWVDDTYVDHEGKNHPHVHGHVFFVDNFTEGVCNDVVPVRMTFPTKDSSPVTAAVEELVHRGPSVHMKRYLRITTAIPDGTRVNSFTIEDGVAKVDFNARVEAHNNTCYNRLIRAQVTETLLQFDDVSDLVISVEGETEGVLPVEAADGGDEEPESESDEDNSEDEDNSDNSEQ